jgi:hypothetical protein
MNRVIQYLVRTSVIAVALVVLHWLFGLVLPPDRVMEEVTGVVGRLGLALLGAFVLAAPLSFPIARSRLSGRALFGVVFLAVFGLTTVLTEVESALFLDMTGRELLIGVLELTIASAVLSWLAVALYPRSGVDVAGRADGPNPPTTASWVRRWIGVACIYLVLYITAGLLILPTIRSWYEAQGTLQPNPAVVLPLQIVRGALFVAFVVPLLRSMRATRWQGSVAMAVMIPLVHGVSALIPPNPFMPDYVRHAHMIEIGWSNFVLGLLIGFLFWNPTRSGEVSTQSPGDAA